MKVLVLLGGRSPEREVSLRSGAVIAKALQEAGHEVVSGDPADKGFVLSKAGNGVDMVFPILHGEGGEDGELQTEMETLGVPFLGSRRDACKLTFDKGKYLRFVQEHRIKTPRGQVVDLHSIEESPLTLKPFVLKPIDGGSSVDVFIVRDPHNPPDYKETLKRYGKMLQEELVVGPELTVGVLDHTALPVILIVPPEGGEFDYENKYNGKSQEIVDPPEVSEEIQHKAKALAEEVHRLTGCRHLSRTDIMVDEQGQLFVLETNTIPGLTDQSLFPKAAEQAGYDIVKLVEKFVAMVERDG